MIDKIKAQLEHLNDRERIMVYAAAIALAVFIPYQFIWAPIMNTVEDQREKVEKQERDLVWMQSHLEQVRQLSTSSTDTASTGQALYGVVEKTARQKFGADIRVQQEGKNGIRIQIKNSGFDDVMIWLDDLQFRHKIFVKDFKIDTEKGVGRVRASILVES
jgi:type II secretory pathway component PulM